MRRGNLKPIVTVVDGIEMRSRLEAAWYLFFQRLGFKPEYEPDTFELPSHAFEIEPNSNGFYVGPYTPDFYIPEADLFVEIKPNRKTYPLRDQQSIYAAYVLGYEHPTAVICGTPMDYRAFVSNERHHGSPEGYITTVGYNKFNQLDDIWLDCYPDETPHDNPKEFDDFRKHITPQLDVLLGEWCETYYLEGVTSWNETKWMAK